MKQFLVIILFLPATSVTALAVEATQVRVSIGKVTQVTLPENIARVVKGGSADSVLVEAVDNTLYVLPKNNPPSDLYVTGASGRSYPLALKVDAQHDIEVSVDGGKRLNRSSAGIEPLAVMREVLLGEVPPNADQVEVGASVKLTWAPIELEFKKKFTFPGLAVYLITARNLSKEETVLSLQNIMFKGMLAITASSDILAAKGQDNDSAEIVMAAAGGDEQ